LDNGADARLLTQESLELISRSGTKELKEVIGNYVQHKI
jgi:hypothetical protein